MASTELFCCIFLIPFRKMLTANQEQNGHLSDVEVVLDWSTLKCDSTDQVLDIIVFMGVLHGYHVEF